MTSIFKIAKWGLLSLLVLFILAICFYMYLVFSFDTENFPENHGKVRTELFLGEGDNQPLIVGFGGSEGGNAWASNYWKAQRDVFLSQGYAFLAVGYFGMEGTPKELDRIALEGVHAAIMDAASNPEINQECIAVMGGSKGAELSLVLASKYPDIKAVVAIVPGLAIFAGNTIAMNTSSFSLNGDSLPFVPVPWSATPALIKGDLRAAWEEMLKNHSAVEISAIEVEKINGPIFLFSAIKDEMWPSTEMSDSMEQRLEDNNYPFYVEHISINGDHSSPLDHFDKIEDFLLSNFMQENSTNCAKAL